MTCPPSPFRPSRLYSPDIRPFSLILIVGSKRNHGLDSTSKDQPHTLAFPQQPHFYLPLALFHYLLGCVTNMASLSRNPTATTLSPPTDRTSPPMTGSECNNASVNLQPGGFLPADPWSSPNPMFPWPYLSSPIDPRLWVWPTGIHPLFGPGPTLPNYPEISPGHPWIPNLGYPAIPNLPLNVSPFENSVAASETLTCDNAPAEKQPENPDNDRQADLRK